MKNKIEKKPCPKCLDKGYMTMPGNHDTSCDCAVTKTYQRKENDNAPSIKRIKSSDI